MVHHHNDQITTLERQLRTTRWVLAATGVCLVALLAGAGADAPPKRVVGVTSIASVLFRVFDDGTVDFLNVQAEGSPLPGWGEVPVDLTKRQWWPFQNEPEPPTPQP